MTDLLARARERTPFCANDECEFHETLMGRNEGDRLRFDDGTYLLRDRVGPLLFCRVCANAIAVARRAAIRQETT